LGLGILTVQSQVAYPFPGFVDTRLAMKRGNYQLITSQWEGTALVIAAGPHVTMVVFIHKFSDEVLILLL
jgi:hypothetical protein